MGEMIMSYEPWDYLNSILRFRDDDSQFWWDKTGMMFSKLLKYAGYSTSEQYRELNFYSLFVAPELGPSPDSQGNVRRWKSPGTPDSTPIDFSWEWGCDNRAVIRYSFEPIGLHAGTDLDPLNQYATNDWIFKLQQQNMVPGLDLDWYNHFTDQILPRGNRTKTVDRFIEETTPKAGTVVALDIEKSGPVMKIYIYPGLKAEELGITNLELVEQSIRNLPAEQFQSLSAEPLFEFLREGTKKYDFETGILAIDCLAPKDARIKVYVRAKHTTFNYMMDCITLGGRLDMSGEAIDDLKDFWRTFLADAPDILPADAPGRASPGFYYTLGNGREISPKVYISPNYFSKNDVDVLARLRQFFSSRRTDSMMDNYEQALKDIFGSKTLESRCGSHYYVGCALHKGHLRVVTYLSPQSFDCEKDRIQGVKS
ncbi:aromatic prenyltransferase [Colletotrichum graminicola]|uniref:Aromatic prenyltransferase n=1 Tax=Colletotrichum graminicola (strain M1.001 / M2 / FGSC 10212) TaxID=645133 RepID=E3QPE6_COLGM|nr:aromatic prenyltransferase [Colletotrichum graminicola M1.001]EFQ32734.1 aromatic prenyltransferase [Colletotrichum graminicola M1.001]WDK18043.1 aromatic prenyltransferase [Colletotrichum graminicola]